MRRHPQHDASGPSGADSRSMPSQYQGFVKGPATNGWRPAKILVDIDSQQPPFMSANLANEMGLARSDIQVDGAECANGDILPIYSVVNVNLAINGLSESIKFYSSDIHPYDVILGEDWLHHNRDILDYDSYQLLTRDVHDGVTPLYLNELPPGVEETLGQLWIVECGQFKVRNENKIFSVNRWVPSSNGTAGGSVTSTRGHHGVSR